MVCGVFSVTGFRHGRRRLIAACLGITFLAGAAACGTDREHVPEKVPPRPAAADSPAIAPADLTRLPAADTYASLPEAPRDPSPRVRTDGTVLHPLRDIAVFDQPLATGHPFARLPIAQVGSPTWVPVVARQDQWAQILLPARPNAATGWVDLGDGSAVTLAQTPFEVHVSTTTFQMTVTENGNPLGRWTVGTGRPETPTPVGRTFIMASIEETVNTFSPLVLPLGAHSESHETFGGGPGTVALHGWPDTSPFGKRSSDGCIRVPDDALGVLSTLPIGSIVLIE